MSFVQTSKWLDSGILGLLLILVSAYALRVASQSKFSEYPFSNVLFKIINADQINYNLSHILLFSLLIAMLSLRPDADYFDEKKRDTCKNCECKKKA